MDISYVLIHHINTYIQRHSRSTDTELDLSTIDHLYGSREQGRNWEERLHVKEVSINTPLSFHRFLKCRLTWENINFFCCWLEQERVENIYFVLVERCVSACVGKQRGSESVCGCVREIADWEARQRVRRGTTEVVIDDCWFELLLKNIAYI